MTLDNLHEADGHEDNVTTGNADTTQEENTAEKPVEKTPEVSVTQSDEHLSEVNNENAEDAEDKDNYHRHQIAMEDYHVMSLDELVDALAQLIQRERIQVIREHVESIKSEFNNKYDALVEEKKEAFIQDGGNELDFEFSLPVRQKFFEQYNEYKNNRNQYYKNLEKSLHENLSNRLEIIEELKSLINVEENINTTYKHFRELQERWKIAGPIPRNHYNDVWQTYHHHVEIFYDFMDLNKDMRDLDFKHNQEQKLKLIEKAEALKNETNVNVMFRELQLLHKIWKEEIGPVAKEQREEVWEKFSAATKVLHERRQEFLRGQEKDFEANLQKKQEIISKIEELSEPVQKHGDWQKRIHEIEKLRQDFFNTGKVPLAENEKTWKQFKSAVRKFNHTKNEFYKNLKKDQHENLVQKNALLAQAVALKDSEDWETATPIMKKIQAEWSSIGHVPRKVSDKIWKEFKAACNHYFDRFHESKRKGNQEGTLTTDQKFAFIQELEAIELPEDKAAGIDILKGILEKWKQLDNAKGDQRAANAKFSRTFDKLCKSLKLDPNEIEMLRFNNRVEHFAKEDEDRLKREKIYLRKRIDEVNQEIRQLENNVQFFNVSDPKNPLFTDVLKNIERHKSELNLLKEKLKALRSVD